MKIYSFRLSEKYLGWILFAALSLLLSPMIDLGYFWDENVTGATYGAAQLNHWNLLQWMFHTVEYIVKDQGRFYPLSTLVTASVYFGNRILAHFVIYALTLAGVWLAAELFSKLTRTPWARVWTFLGAFFIFQVRLGPDPHHGYLGLTQFQWLQIAASLLFFLRYLEGSKARDYGISIALFATSVFTYEIAYPYFALYFVLAWAHKRKPWRITAPYVACTLISGLMTLILRMTLIQSLPATNAGYVFSLDPLPFLDTLLKQMSAAVPLSYPALGSLRSREPVSFHEILTFMQTSWGVLATLATGLALFALCRIVFVTEPHENPKPFVSKRSLYLFGIVLWILPGLMLALSGKYQTSGLIDWGAGYIPVFQSFFGILLIGVLLGLDLQSQWARGKRRGVGVLLAIVFPVVILLNDGNSRLNFAKLNQYFLTPREVVESALKNGILDPVPQQAYLLADVTHFPGPITAFYYQHSGKAFRRIAPPGRFLGEPEPTSLIQGELFIPHLFETIPPTLKEPVSTNLDRKKYQLDSKDAVYYFYYRPTAASHQGYAILGEVQTLDTSSRAISEALTHTARVFLWNIDPEGLGFLKNPDWNITTASRGNDWVTLEIRSKTEAPINLVHFK